MVELYTLNNIMQWRIVNWKVRFKVREEWKESIEEAKLCIGMSKKKEEDEEEEELEEEQYEEEEEIYICS